MFAWDATNADSWLVLAEVALIALAALTSALLMVRGPVPRSNGPPGQEYGARGLGLVRAATRRHV